MTLMRTALRLTTATSALCLFATGAHAGQQQGTVSVVSLQPLSLVNVSDLEFGRIIPGTTAGTVVINPNTGARTKTGGPTLYGTGGQAAQFWTYGGPLQWVQVTRGPLPVLTRQGGGGSMNVTQLTLNGATTRYLNGAGFLDLRVGGTLAVGANQATGNYSGTFNITVTYF